MNKIYQELKPFLAPYDLLFVGGQIWLIEHKKEQQCTVKYAMCMDNDQFQHKLVELICRSSQPVNNEVLYSVVVYTMLYCGGHNYYAVDRLDLASFMIPRPSWESAKARLMLGREPISLEATPLPVITATNEEPKFKVGTRVALKRTATCGGGNVPAKAQGVIHILDESNCYIKMDDYFSFLNVTQIHSNCLYYACSNIQDHLACYFDVLPELELPPIEPLNVYGKNKLKENDYWGALVALRDWVRDHPNDADSQFHLAVATYLYGRKLRDENSQEAKLRSVPEYARAVSEMARAVGIFVAAIKLDGNLKAKYDEFKATLSDKDRRMMETQYEEFLHDGEDDERCEDCGEHWTECECDDDEDDDDYEDEDFDEDDDLDEEDFEEDFEDDDEEYEDDEENDDEYDDDEEDDDDEYDDDDDE